MKRHLPRFFDSSIFSQFRPITPTLLLLGTTLTLLAPTSLPAQTLTFTGATLAVNFGSANLCKPGQTEPAPCSKIVTLDYKVTAGGTLGTPKVLTLGSPNLDFVLANGTTCTGGVTPGETCVVNVQFAPRLAGGRTGAVQLVNESGKVLAVMPIWGTGVGPQIAALSQGAFPKVTPAVGRPSYFAAQPAVDGAGDVFLAFNEGSVVELPADGGPQITLPFKFDSSSYGPSGGTNGSGPAGLAVDGAGDVFVTVIEKIPQSSYGSVIELPAGGGPQTTLPFPALAAPSSLTADGAGDIFVLDYFTNTPDPNDARVVELPSGCQSSSCAKIIPLNVGVGIEGIEADAGGDLFVLSAVGDTVNYSQVVKYPAGGGSPIVLISSPDLVVGLTREALAVDGVGDLFTIDLGATYGSYDNYFTDLNALEYPAGSPSPISFGTVGYIEDSDGYDSNTYGFTVDAAGDLFLATEAVDDYAVTEYIHDQFAPLNFGSIPLGTSKTLPLSITNQGNANLIISPYLESPSYKILSQNPAYCLGGTLPGRTCNVNIQFTALSEGPHTITLTLGSNGANDSNVLLEGAGTK